MENIFINPGRVEWNGLLRRPVFDSASLESIVSPILQDVKQHGDQAIRRLAEKFDGVILDELKVSASEIDEAALMVSDDLKTAIALAKNNIAVFHEAQQEIGKPIETTDGVVYKKWDCISPEVQRLCFLLC
jgi:histidinol dehydrogenase